LEYRQESDRPKGEDELNEDVAIEKIMEIIVFGKMREYLDGKKYY